MMKSTTTLLFFLVAGLLFGSAEEAQAQYRRGGLGIGGQLGDPSGLTLKLYRRPGFAYDFLLAWDLDADVLFLNVHGLYERPLRTAPVRFFYGPGLYVGFRDRDPADDEVVLGISGSFGVNYFIEQFELFAQLTPRLRVVPDTDGSLGGGIGLRFYL